MKKSEFERLQSGQIIQNKKVPEWAFIVHQNFGGRVTAVRTIEISNPEDWEVITKVQIVEAPDNSRFEKAANDLHETLKNESWYNCIGMAKDTLIVYTKAKQPPMSCIQFAGFPVKYKFMGKVRPLVKT